MKKIFLGSTAIVLLFYACSSVQSSDESQIKASTFLTPDILCGTVQFSDGCGPTTDSLISFGLALVHHMTFDDAEHIFDQVIKSDPDCFWGHWGKALTFIHPLWPDEPSTERLQQGLVLSQKALALARKPKEHSYGQAMKAYYENGQTRSEKERLGSYREAWAQINKNQADDIEARLFHGLSRLALVSPDDKSYVVQREVGKTAEDVLLEIPDHPGGFHYAIHAYDSPLLASNALRVARNYGKIAPEIPHALHMPTHIFTRLGYWKESIDWNIRSARAAAKMPVNGQTSLHFLHALDYLVYAYLQEGEDKKAQDILVGLDTLTGPIQTHAASAYALASIPARYALERKDWTMAAKITPRKPERFEWNKFPAFEAISHFAQGIGAARSGDPKSAEISINHLDSLQKSMGTAKSTWYWRQQIEIQRMIVEAWQAWVDQNYALAERRMLAAVDIEDALDKNPITPGEILPANEQMGDLMLDLNRPKDALQFYNKSLLSSPNRLNSFYGGFKAASLLNDKQAIDGFRNAWEKLVDKNLTGNRIDQMRLEFEKVI